jgi:hypothetical protein
LNQILQNFESLLEPKAMLKKHGIEFIHTDPHNTVGATTIVFARKSVRLKTLTEIGSTFNSGQHDLVDHAQANLSRFMLI